VNFYVFPNLKTLCDLPTQYSGQKKKKFTKKNPDLPPPSQRLSRHQLGLIILVLKKSNTQFKYMTMVIKKSKIIF
jgi:hypothetical protein